MQHGISEDGWADVLKRKVGDSWTDFTGDEAVIPKSGTGTATTAGLGTCQRTQIGQSGLVGPVVTLTGVVSLSGLELL